MFFRGLMMAALAASLGTGWFSWRYNEIGNLFIQNRNKLSAQVYQAAHNDSGGSGVAVALILERNEDLFEHTLALGAAQRTARVLALFCAGALSLSVAAAAWERRRQKSQSFFVTPQRGE